MVALHQGKIGYRYVGSATCTTDNGQPIVGMVNEAGPSFDTIDQLFTYEMISM